MSHTFHVANYSGTSQFRGWVRRTIDWQPPAERGEIDGCRFVVGRELVPGLRHIDVHVELDPGEVKSLDFTSYTPPPEADEAPPVEERPDWWPHIAGVPFLVRSSQPNGAGLDMHWRTRVGDLVVDLWATVYSGQPFVEGKLQVHASNISSPETSAVVPEGFVLSMGEHFATRGAWSTWGAPLVEGGTVLAMAQGLPAIPVVAAPIEGGDRESATAVGEMSIAAIGIDEVWPTLGNPLWHANAGDPRDFVRANYARVKRSMRGLQLTPLTFSSRAGQVSGGEPDQVFKGGELAHGTKSLGADLMMWMRGASMARRPGLWSELDGSRLRLDRGDLAMFEGYPFERGGTQDFLGMTAGIPNQLDTSGWWCWREHFFHNALFVGYRVTGCPALQWQIERRAVTYFYEHTLDARFSTTPYTGADRGYWWSCLFVWWCHHSIEDKTLRDAVDNRWRDRWAAVGRGRMTRPLPFPQFWGDTWFAWQCGQVQFLDMVGKALDVPEAREAAFRVAKHVVDHAYSEGDEAPFGYVKLDGNEVRQPIEQHSNAGGGVTGWMIGAAATVLRHDPDNAKARRLLQRDVNGNRLGGDWIPPDMLR